MLTIHALDTTAEERESLVRWLEHLLHEDTPEIEFIPRTDIRPVSFEELKFHGTPDICFVGPRMLERELSHLGHVRKLLPTTPIVACTTERLESLAQIEQLARLGATDTLSLSDSASTLLRKIVLLSKKKSDRHGGKLIVVDSGKGGVGVTSIAASLGELAALDEKRTALIDFDFETQDLSRFLQSKPFINENFQLLLEGARSLSQDFVKQCVSKVWEDDEFLFHVAPPPESDALYASDTKMLRALLSFFEVLDETFDCIIVDAGSCRGAMQKTLYRAADQIVFVLNNDPATLYSSVDRLKKMKEVLSPHAGLTVVDNGGQHGLSRKMLLNEFSRAAALNPEVWHSTGIPFCKSGSRWPASGGTFVSLTKQAGRDGIEELAATLGLIEPRESALGSFKKLLSRAVKRDTNVARSAEQMALPNQRSLLMQTNGEARKALPFFQTDTDDVFDKPKRSLLELIQGGEDSDSLGVTQKRSSDDQRDIAASKVTDGEAEAESSVLAAPDLISRALIQ